jgi:hypothetical protein
MTLVRDIPVELDPGPKLTRLTRGQYDAFHRDGFLFVPKLFEAVELAPLRRLISDEPLIRKTMTKVLDSDGNPVDLFGWSGTANDLLGAYVRVARLVEMTRDLFAGEEIYHWHSKLSIKRPNAPGRWDWHQDYGFWYFDGCLWPDMLSVMVALDPNTRENGCVELVRGSHKMGRIDHGSVGKAVGADMEVVERAAQKMQSVYCVLEPGDAVFFHSNTLHASGPNKTDAPRTLLHVSYNTVRNQPWKPLMSHPFEPLEVLSDDVLKTGDIKLAIDSDRFAAFHAARDGEREKTGDTFGYRALFKKREGALATSSGGKAS